MPLKKALDFNLNALEAWKIIKETCTDDKSKEEGIEIALLIKNDDPHTTLEALEKGIPAKYVRSFTNQYKVSAWEYIEKWYDISLEEKIEYSLKIDTNIKLQALESDVDPTIADQFDYPCQVEAWSKKIRHMTERSAEDALIVNTEVRLNALNAGVSLDQVRRFENQTQVDAYKLIEPQLIDKELCIYLALAATKEVHIKALKAGVPPRDAIEFEENRQVTAWEKMKDRKDINKLQVIKDVRKLKNDDQLDVLVEGASLEDALKIRAKPQAVAFISYKLPLELALKYDANHKLELLRAGIDQEKASKANWKEAQWLLIKSNPIKYLAELPESFINEVKSLYENPKRFLDYMTLVNGAITMASIGVFLVVKNCCSRKTTVSNTKTRSNRRDRRGDGEDGGVEMTSNGDRTLLSV